MAIHNLPQHVIDKLISQIHADPGLPKSNASVSGWQVPPDPLSEAKSASLPRVTDFAIIGSGASGCSVASSILENDPLGRKVTVFEARTLASGATGRNGGHLLSHIPKFYKAFRSIYGKEATIEVARYCLKTVDKMLDLADSGGLRQASEVRSVREIMAFQDEADFREAVSSVQLYEEDLPEQRGQYQIIDQDSAKKVIRVFTRQQLSLFYGQSDLYVARIFI
jgi:glycine/D-amino acid oxidase-like deaminating enzyme